MPTSIAWQAESFGIEEGALLSLLAVPLFLWAFWLWMLIEAASWPRSTWEAAGASRGRWLLRIVILGAIGAIWYWRRARSGLRTTYADVRWGR